MRINRLFKLALLCLTGTLSFSTPAGAWQIENQTLPVPPADPVAPAPGDTVRLRQPFIIPDSLRYQFFGDGTFARGNVNRSLIILRTEVNYDGPVVSLATNPRFAYGNQNGELAERELYLDLFVDLYKKRKVYAFGLATLESSNLRGINFRQLAGAGVGWRLHESERNKLSLTTAIIYEDTDFRTRASLTTLRNSTRLKGKHSFFADRMRITHITFVQPTLLDSSRRRWSTLISVELPLSKWFTLRSSFENSFESLVESGRQRNDSRLTVGFSIGNRE